jgi:hypothetical protein
MDYFAASSPLTVGKITVTGDDASLEYTEGRGYASMFFPVIVEGDYQLQFLVKWPTEYISAYVSLPAGPDRMTGFGLDFRRVGFRVGERSWRSDANPALKGLPARLETNRPYRVILDVKRSGETVTLNAAINNRPCVAWTGSADKLEPGPRTLSETGMRIFGARLRPMYLGKPMLMIKNGAAKLVTPEMIAEQKPAKVGGVDAPVVALPQGAGVAVSARVPWTTVGRVEAGKTYTILASGEWGWGGSSRCGPNGDNNGGHHLRARVGAGAPVKIGSKYTFKAVTDGVVQAGMSDQGDEMPGRFHDNKGALQVQLKEGTGESSSLVPPAGPAAPAVPAVPGKMPPGAVLNLTFDAEAPGVKAVEGKVGPGGVSGHAFFMSEKGYLMCPDRTSLDIPGPMTISMWIRPQNWSNGGGLCTKGFGVGGESWLLDMQGSRIRFVRREAERPHKYIAAYSTEKIRPKRWYHVVAVDSGTSYVLYVNGRKGKEVPHRAVPALVNDHEVTFGCRQSGKGAYDDGISGAVDQAAIWRRALSAQEVAVLYGMHSAAAAQASPPAPPDSVKKKPLPPKHKKPISPKFKKKPSQRPKKKKHD